MVPANAPLVTHPLTRFDIVDTALDVIKAAPGVILGATAMFLVPFEVVSVALRRNQLGLDDVSTGVTASFLAAVVLRLLTISFVTFAVTHVLWAWQRGEAPRARTAAAAALRRAPGLVLAWVLVHLAEAAALAAFGVPYLIVAPLLLCTVPVMAVEGRSALSAMGRSWRLGLRELGLALGEVPPDRDGRQGAPHRAVGRELLRLTDAIFDAPRVERRASSSTSR